MYKKGSDGLFQTFGQNDDCMCVCCHTPLSSDKFAQVCECTEGWEEAERRVLSIQSSVVYGYVGNKSATFPLQLLGFDVSTINSVQFSNHTGYGKWRGQVLDADHVGDLFDGLRMNNLMHFSHILTGYMGLESFLAKVGRVIAQMKETNPHMIYVCDPVLGDNGKFYVRKELASVYREMILPLADIITPNQFELEQLSGVKITKPQEAFDAMDVLHQKGSKMVVLSSSTSLGPKGYMMCLASRAVGMKRELFKMKIPKHDAIFVGTGDLFSAALLGWMHWHEDLKVALEKTVATLQGVINNTMEYAAKAAGDGHRPSTAQMELRLIQSKAAIENPEVTVFAQEVFYDSLEESFQADPETLTNQQSNKDLGEERKSQVQMSQSQSKAKSRSQTDNEWRSSQDAQIEEDKRRSNLQMAQSRSKSRSGMEDTASRAASQESYSRRESSRMSQRSGQFEDEDNRRSGSQIDESRSKSRSQGYVDSQSGIETRKQSSRSAADNQSRQQLDNEEEERRSNSQLDSSRSKSKSSGVKMDPSAGRVSSRQQSQNEDPESKRSATDADARKSTTSASDVGGRKSQEGQRVRMSGHENNETEDES